MKLQEYLNQKYLATEQKSAVKEIILSQINEILEGGELDLREFPNLEKIEIDQKLLKTPLTKLNLEGLTHLKAVDWLESKEDSPEEKQLWTELGIEEDLEKQKVVKEVNKLGELKGSKVNFGTEVKEGEISLNWDKKDKHGNFCPSLVFWTLANELALMEMGGGKTDKTPEFWTNLDKELEWVKDNLNENYQKEFTNLLTLSTFPTDKLDLNLLAVYFPNSEPIANAQIATATVKPEIVNGTWQTIKQEALDLISKELEKNPSEDKLTELGINLGITYNSDEYNIEVRYHPQTPFSKELELLVKSTSLHLEIKYLKKEKSELPTTENFVKLKEQIEVLKDYLQGLIDEETYQEIKEKIEKIN